MLAVFLAFALAGAPDAGSAAGAGRVSGADQPVATLVRHGCFGTCPSYDVALHTDGRIDYRGHAYAPIEGKAALRTRKEDVDWLLDLARRAGYLGLEDH